MCVSMSVRGIFEFDQPVNSVSVQAETFRSSRFTLVIGKFILQKKNTVYIIVIISLMNYLMN